jgi:hypothetical protein
MTRVTAGLVFAAALMGSAIAAQQPTSFNVFFDQNSEQLTPDAAQIVASAANTIRHTRNARIIVSTGNPRLGEGRFHSVQAALIADGVDSRRIVRANLVATPIAYDPVLADRVEIRLQSNLVLRTAMTE